MKGNLESSLGKYIENLKEYKFYVPEDLVKKSACQIKPDEFGMYHDVPIDILVTIFKDVLELLRDEKISFWKKLYQKYKEDKEGYDLEFTSKSTRHKKDLDRASKITYEDFKDLI